MPSNPARVKLALTEQRIKNLRPAASRYIAWDAVVPNFGLRVSPTGTKSYLVARSLNGTTKLVFRVLGRWPAITLDEARAAAREELGALARGVHPKELEEQRLRELQKARRDTVASVVADYVRLRVGKLRGRKEEEARLRRLVECWGERPVISITRRDVVELLEEITTKRGPYSAAHLHSTIRSFYNWAINRDFYGLETSPCDRLRGVEIYGQLHSRDRALSDDEIRWLWHAAGQLSPMHGALVKMWLLTGQRRNEVARAKWTEVDFSRRTLTIPAPRMKGGERHVVPLTATAIGLLEALPSTNGFIFSTTGGKLAYNNFSHLKQQIAAPRGGATDEMERWSFHDLRRTVRTRMAQLGVDLVVAEMCLAHRQRGIAAVYNVHQYRPEMAVAFDRWERHLLELVGEAPEGSVVEFPRRA
jgi:integrase